MKKLLVLLLLSPLAMLGQTITTSQGSSGTAHEFKGTVVMDSALNLPKTLTFNPTRPGAIRYNPSTQLVEILDNSLTWVPIGSGGGAADGNNYVTGLSYDSASRTFTLSRQGMSSLTTVFPRIPAEVDPVFSVSPAASITFTNILNWQEAYNKEIVDVGVSGTTTKTITLTQKDGSTLSTTFTDIANTGSGGITTESDPIYSANGVPKTRTLTINGQTLDLSANRTFSIPTYSAGTGISIVGGVISATGGISSETDPLYSANGVPKTRTLTINGQTFDLSSNRSWTISGLSNIYSADGTVTANRTLQSAFPLHFNFPDNAGIPTGSFDVNLGSAGQHGQFKAYYDAGGNFSFDARNDVGNSSNLWVSPLRTSAYSQYISGEETLASTTYEVEADVDHYKMEWLGIKDSTAEGFLLMESSPERGLSTIGYLSDGNAFQATFTSDSANLGYNAGDKYTPEIHGVKVTSDGDVAFHNYRSTRDDGSTSKALYVGSDGKIKYGPVTGAGGTGADGNFYPTSMSFSGTTLTLNRNTLTPLTANLAALQDGNNFLTGLSLSGTTLTATRSGLASVTANLSGLQDGNNFPSALTFSGTTLTLARTGLANLTANLSGLQDGNNFPSSLSFAPSTGILTMGRTGLGNLTSSLDGRYKLLSTLDSNNYVTAATLSGNTLTLTRLGLADLTVDLSSISGAGAADGNNFTSAVTLSGTTLTTARTGLSSLTTDLSSLKDGNNFTSGLSYNTTTGVLTETRTGLTNLTATVPSIYTANGTISGTRQVNVNNNYLSFINTKGFYVSDSDGDTLDVFFDKEFGNRIGYFSATGATTFDQFDRLTTITTSAGNTNASLLLGTVADGNANVRYDVQRDLDKRGMRMDVFVDSVSFYKLDLLTFNRVAGLDFRLQGLPNTTTANAVYINPANGQLSYGGPTTDGNNFTSSASLSGSTLTMARTGLSDLTVDLTPVRDAAVAEVGNTLYSGDGVISSFRTVDLAGNAVNFADAGTSNLGADASTTLTISAGALNYYTLDGFGGRLDMEVQGSGFYFSSYEGAGSTNAENFGNQTVLQVLRDEITLHNENNSGAVDFNIFSANHTSPHSQWMYAQGESYYGTLLDSSGLRIGLQNNFDSETGLYTHNGLRMDSTGAWFAEGAFWDAAAAGGDVALVVGADGRIKKGASTGTGAGGLATNLYNSNGTITEERVVDITGHSVAFNGSPAPAGGTDSTNTVRMSDGQFYVQQQFGNYAGQLELSPAYFEVWAFQDTSYMTGHIHMTDEFINIEHYGSDGVSNIYLDGVSGIQFTSASGQYQFGNLTEGTGTPLVVDEFGNLHTQTGGSGSADGNNFPSSLSFSAGTLTLGRTGLSDLTVSLDGRYLQSEVDGSTSNELQTLSLTGHDVTLSNGGGTVTIPDESLYTANGTLTGDRTVTGAGNDLNLNGLGSFYAETTGGAAQLWMQDDNIMLLAGTYQLDLMNDRFKLTGGLGHPDYKVADSILVRTGDNDIRAISIAETYNKWERVKKYMGADMKGEVVYMNALEGSLNGAMSDGRLYLLAADIPQEGTLTGIRFMAATQGSFTADAYNGVGLYSVNKATGVLTLVASSTNSGTTFSSAANTWVEVPFSTPLSISTGGVYYIGLLYNSSAQTTAPSVLARPSTVQSNLVTLGSLPNGLKLAAHVTGQASLPSTVTMSSATATTSLFYAQVY